LREHESTELVCSAIGIGASSYYERRKRQRLISAKRRILRARVKRLFDKSRQSAGNRTIVSMLRDEGIIMGRFKAGRLMKEQGLMSKQPGKHAYKNVQVERPDIPNLLDRQFDFEKPNQVWCGDITYI
jgi:putative transposase